MKKRLLVKQKHRYQKERHVMYKGPCDYEKKADYIKLCYQEEQGEHKAEVEVLAYPDYMVLKRKGELESELMFIPSEKSKGSLTSIYGTIDINIHTYRYIRKDTVVTLEYDILSDENETDGYHILWDIQEV